MFTTVDKLITALLGGLTEAIAAGLVPDSAKIWVGIIVAALTGAGVWAIPNKPSVAKLATP